LHTQQSDTAPAGERRTDGMRLRFRDADLERQFILSYRASAHPWVRLSLLVALLSASGFTIIDHLLLVGPRLARPDIWRFGLQFPLVIIMLVLTQPRWYARWYQPAIQLAAPLFGAGTVLMAVEATPAQLPLVSARLLLAAFYFYFMLGMTFGAAVRTNMLLVAVYAGAALFGEFSSTVATYSLFSLFSANLIGGAGSYALEYANRVAFLERRRLSEVAMHDGLTGLLNRTALEQQARALWQHAQVTRVPVSVLLIDIDHFKAYNDCYGHQAGDGCLKQVAAAIRTAVQRRPLDMVARYGGEEIIGILVGGDRVHAAAAAEAISKAVADLGIVHGGSTTRPYVTVSVGVTTVDPGGDYSHEHAVRCADLALYTAKARGRDGWSFHEPAEQPRPADHQLELLKTAS
jgi:diguanylate cyclase (GGDEF)-like protein